MKVGLGIGGPLPELGDQAARAEAAGFESVWVAELDHSGFVQSAAAIARTCRIGIGTAVALAFPRSPTIAAMTAWDLDELSGERFYLGLGPQVKRVMEDRFSVEYDRPAERLAEYVAAVRTVWLANRGEPAVHEGTHYRITMPTFHGGARPERRDVPILLAAVGPVLSRVSGEVADGLVGHPLASPRYLAEVVRPAIADGIERAGRPPGACPITASVLVSIAGDPDAARKAARLQLAFYATTPSYLPILELHGRAALPRELRRAFVRGDRERMADLVDDELLDAIAIAGRADEVVDRIADWAAVADRALLATPWYGVDSGFERENFAAILDLGSTFAADPVDAPPG